MAVVIAFLVIDLIIIAYAWRLGGGPERVGAAIVAAMIIVTYGGYAFLPHIFNAVDPVGLAVDLIGLVGFSWLGIASRRLWPLWAGSLQLLSTGAHFVRALNIPVRPPVYFWMKSLPTIGVILLLLGGTAAYQLRERRRRSASSRS